MVGWGGWEGMRVVWGQVEEIGRGQITLGHVGMGGIILGRSLS